MENATEPELVDLEPATTAVISATIPAGEIVEFFDRSFGMIAGVLAEQGVVPTGIVFARYRGMPADNIDLEVGFVTDRPAQPTGDVVASELPGGQVARVVHHGSYDGLGAAWGRLGAWIGAQGLVPSPEFWEVYLNEPRPDMDPAELRTELNWPVAG